MILVNSIPVVAGTITKSLNGNWTTLRLIINATDITNFQAGSSVSIVDSNNFTLNGTIKSSGVFTDTVYLDIDGGKGGLNKTPKPQQFSNAFVRDVINSLINSSGEVLSGTIDQTLLNRLIGTWTIFAGSVSIALTNFLNFIDPLLNWRILDDGTLWFGYDNFNTINNTDAVFEFYNAAKKTTKLGVTTLEIVPGINLQLPTQSIGNIVLVEYHITANSIKCLVSNEYNSNDQSIDSILDRIISIKTDHLRFAGLYLGNVISQSTDWTKVDIQSADATAPSMSNIKLLSGQYENIVGQQVLYGWIGMNPNLPFAISFINNSGAVALALAQKTNNNFNNFKSSYDGHTHLYTPGTLAQAASAAPNNPLPTPTDVSTSKIKGS